MQIFNMFNFDSVIQLVYLVAAFSFIYGLKKMSSPKTASMGIIWAGIGMLVATVVTFFHSQIDNLILMVIAT